MENDGSCIYRAAAVLCAALFTLLSGCLASVAHGAQDGYEKASGLSFKQILHLWSLAWGDNFQYPGKNGLQPFDALLWVRLTQEGRAQPVRLLSLAARRSKKFCMVQLASNGLVAYCASDGAKFRTMLFDPRGSGALVAVVTRAPVIETFCGVTPSQSHTMCRMVVLKKPGRHAFFVSFSRIWLRLVSRHADYISFNTPKQMLTIRTRAPSSTRFTLSGWTIRGHPHRLAIVVSAVDRRVARPHMKVSFHLRLSPSGLFQRLPYFAKDPAARVLKLDTRRIGRSNFVERYRASVAVSGLISSPAAVARRRFLNWAVGRKEAGKLDGWVDKGIAPFSPAGKKIAGGAK